MSTKSKVTIYQQKPRYRYVPVQEILENEDGKYVTYSISVRTIEEEVAYVKDVTTKLDKIQELTDQFTKDQLDPKYLDMLIDSFIRDELLL